MEVAQFIEVLRVEGTLLSAAAARHGLDAPIITCPGWLMRDLVRHTAGVHRWAAGYVAQRRMEAWDVDLDEVVGTWPEDADLLDWFRSGHAALVDALTAAPADLQCHTFLAAPTPLAMWSRRQAHETTIHRVDAESAGSERSPIAPRVAADGIDELLSCFITRGKRYGIASERRTLQVHATDTDDRWLVTMTPSGVVTTTEAGSADCTVTGEAEALYLLLWNRAGRDHLSISGDARLLDLWKERIQIRWS